MSDDAYTTNGYFELPGLGKKGESERQLFNAGLERVDSALGVQVGNVGFEDLDTALTAIGSAKTVLRLRNISTTISTNTTIPANVTLSIPIGALLAIDNGVTLTINGPLDVAGPYQIFVCTGTGKVEFGSMVDRVYPDWWATNTNPGTTNMAAAISAAIDSFTTGVVQFLPTTYAIGTNTTVPATATLGIPLGALLAVANGVTLTINGFLNVGPYQLFSCSGTGSVVFNTNTPEVYPDWWASNASPGTTDMSAAIQAATDSLTIGMVQFLPTIYSVGTTINGKSHVGYRGGNR